MVDDNLYTLCASLNLFLKTNPAEIYNFIVKNKSWPLVKRCKKHRALDHYKNSSSSAAENNKNFRPPLPPCSGGQGLDLGKDGKVNQVYIKLPFYLLDCSLILVLQKILGHDLNFTVI